MSTRLLSLLLTPLIWIGLTSISPTTSPPRSNADATVKNGDYCKVGGLIYVEPVQGFADYKVFVEDVEAFSNMLVFKESSPGFADAPGIWYFTDIRGAADYIIHFTDVKAFADFTIHYTEFRSIAGCRQ